MSKMIGLLDHFSGLWASNDGSVAVISRAHCFKLAVRCMQRGATIDTHGLCSFLKLVVAGLIVLVMIIVFLLLVAAPSGPLLLIIFVAVASLAAMLLVGSFSTIPTLLLVPPLILGFLLFSKQLNLLAVLEVMALCAVDLAVLLVGASWLVGSRQGPQAAH